MLNCLGRDLRIDNATNLRSRHDCSIRIFYQSSNFSRGERCHSFMPENFAGVRLRLWVKSKGKDRPQCQQVNKKHSN